jgi:hypothetical protein
MPVRDPRESELPSIGRIVLEDAESGELIEVDTGDTRTRERFSASARERRREQLQMLRGAGLDVLELDTCVPYLLPLLRFFRTRAARRRLG